MNALRIFIIAPLCFPSDGVGDRPGLLRAQPRTKQPGSYILEL